jgi:hypothetical protein
MASCASGANKSTRNNLLRRFVVESGPIQELRRTGNDARPYAVLKTTWSLLMKTLTTAGLVDALKGDVTDSLHGNGHMQSSRQMSR